MRGGPTFLGRSLVARYGWRLNEIWGSPRMADANMRGARRRGFEWAIDRLRSEPPALLLRPAVAVVGLFEVWVHREDVARANGSIAEGDTDLAPVVPWLLRYHRRLLRDVALRVVADDGREWRAGTDPEAVVRGPLAEVVLWLAGRGEVARVTTSGDDVALGRLDARLRV
jgi:uncharacterized protein (TIGR03083 family)